MVTWVISSCAIHAAAEIARGGMRCHLERQEPTGHRALLGQHLGRAAVHRPATGCYSWVTGFDVSCQPGTLREESASTNTA